MRTKFLLLASTIILLVSIAIAAHTITPTSYSTNETIQTTFNISINNTNAEQTANITSVNITLPSTFTFTAGTNGSNATASLFTNASNTLSWTNTTGYIINGSETMLFWFNATASTPGSYNISVSTTNITGSYASNITVEINDTTATTATFGTIPINAYNSSSPNVTFGLKCTDADSSPDTIQLWGNWSGTWTANNTNSSPVNNTFSNISITGLSDGTYKWAIYCNDSASNSDWTNTNRTLIIDTTNPTASASCIPRDLRNGEPTTCTCSGTDATSGVSTRTATSTPNTASLSGTQTYTCIVTDYAGNSASATATYVVTDGGGSSSSSSGDSTTFWTAGTHAVTNEQFQNSFTREISVKQRFKIQINSQDHHVGVTGITATTATIEIASDPQTATLSIGDERKFEVTDDNYYDIFVKLNSITNNKANITIKSINELITEQSIIEEKTKENTAIEYNNTATTPSSKTYLWTTGIIVAIVIVVILIIYPKKKKSKK